MTATRLVLAQVNNVFTVIPTLVLSRTRHRVEAVSANVTAYSCDLRWMWFSAILIFTRANIEPGDSCESRSE